MEINIHHLKTPVEIITTQVGIPQDYKQQCIDEIYRLGDSMNQITNVKAIMSSWEIWNETKILNPLIDKITKITDKLIYIDGGFKNKLEHCWSAIYKKGHYTIPHRHTPSNFSFIYYLKSNENSSPLVFNEIDFNLPPQDDLLVIFPSHIVHSVPTQRGNEDRICLAGNIVIREK